MADQVLGRFVDNSRRKVGFVGRIPITLGKKAQPLEFPRVGYMSRVYLRFVGDLNIGAVGGGFLSNELGIWKLLERIGVNVNVQNANLVDISGYGAFIMSHFLERGFNAAVPSDFFGIPTVYQLGSNPLDVILPIQINANHSNDAEAGLIPLHTEGLRTTLDLRFNDLNEITNGNMNVTGEVEVYYEYFEAVNPAAVRVPDLVFLRTIESVQPVIAAGEQNFPIPQLGVLLQMFHYVTANGVITDQIEEILLKVGRTETLTSEPFKLNRMKHRLATGSNLPTGVCGYDFFHAYQKVSEGSLREALDTENVAELESIVKTKTNLTLGGGGANSLTTIRRILQPGVVTI